MARLTQDDSTKEIQNHGALSPILHDSKQTLKSKTKCRNKEKADLLKRMNFLEQHLNCLRLNYDDAVSRQKEMLERSHSNVLNWIVSQNFDNTDQFTRERTKRTLDCADEGSEDAKCCKIEISGTNASCGTVKCIATPTNDSNKSCEIEVPDTDQSCRTVKLSQTYSSNERCKIESIEVPNTDRIRRTVEIAPACSSNESCKLEIAGHNQICRIMKSARTLSSIIESSSNVFIKIEKDASQVPDSDDIVDHGKLHYYNEEYAEYTE